MIRGNLPNLYGKKALPALKKKKKRKVKKKTSPKKK